MSVYRVKLTKKESVADATMAFHFEKPTDFNFTAGQYADYILINSPQTDNKGTFRSFTIASAPYENDIVLITRMRDSAFKRVIDDMKIGTEIKIDGPSGDFTLKQNEYPAVFLTGGVGITPALSIIKQAIHDKVNHQIILFCSNKTVDSAVGSDELSELAQLNDNFKFIHTITNQNDNNVVSETGRIDGDLLRKYIPDLSKPNYYISGPIAMVESLTQLLLDDDVKDEAIFTEAFSGY